MAVVGGFLFSFSFPFSFSFAFSFSVSQHISMSTRSYPVFYLYPHRYIHHCLPSRYGRDGNRVVDVVGSFIGIAPSYTMLVLDREVIKTHTRV